MSITTRLVILYSCTAFVALLISSLFLYDILTINLDRERVQFLADEVSTLREIQAEHPGVDDASLVDEIQSESDPRRFSHYYVRILDQGSAVIEAAGMEKLLPRSAFPPAVAQSEIPVEGTHYRAADDREFLLMSAWVQAGRAPSSPREMQIGLEISTQDGIRSNYRRSMAWTVLLGTFWSTVAAAAMAHRGLRPLHDIERRARGISATQLHERIGSEKWPAELQNLARSFDEMLERLERSFSQLSQFSADLAHELRTPINNLMGEAEVALSRRRDEDEYRRVIESSVEELGHLSSMIDSMLFLARAEAAESPVQLTHLDVQHEFDVVREFYDALAEQRRVTVSCCATASLRADPMLFRRVIGNLLSNALNHTPAGGSIELRADTDAHGVEVCVNDTGCGIEPEHLPRLFDRFYRIDSARSGDHRSTGLGLALVKSIVELHGGSASIRSTPGRGTSVVLRFPTAQS